MVSIGNLFSRTSIRGEILETMKKNDLTKFQKFNLYLRRTLVIVSFIVNNIMVIINLIQDRELIYWLLAIVLYLLSCYLMKLEHECEEIIGLDD